MPPENTTHQKSYRKTRPISHLNNKELVTSLLREAGRQVDAQHIKDVILKPQGLAGLDRAISSAGGVALSELDENCQLRKLPSHYCVGEMLDWDAPTGGYLLQACFSTAVAAARHVIKNHAKSKP